MASCHADPFQMLTRTTTALLEDLVDPANEAVWREFDERYRPALFGLARRLGLREEDAADAAQETLARFVAGFRRGDYDRTRGKLRSWLLGIARNCVVEMQRKAYAKREVRGVSAIVDLPAEADIEPLWDNEVERVLLERSMAELRQHSRISETNVHAFELIAVHNRTPGEVADQLSISVNDVYLAKHRCLKKLRERVAELRELYDVM